MQRDVEAVRPRTALHRNELIAREAVASGLNFNRNRTQHSCQPAMHNERRVEIYVVCLGVSARVSAGEAFLPVEPDDRWMISSRIASPWNLYGPFQGSPIDTRASIHAACRYLYLDIPRDRPVHAQKDFDSLRGPPILHISVFFLSFSAFSRLLAQSAIDRECPIIREVVCGLHPAVVMIDDISGQ